MFNIFTHTPPSAWCNRRDKMGHSCLRFYQSMPIDSALSGQPVWCVGAHFDKCRIKAFYVKSKSTFSSDAHSTDVSFYHKKFANIYIFSHIYIYTHIFIFIYKKRTDTFTMIVSVTLEIAWRRNSHGGTCASLLSHESFPDKATLTDNEARDSEILFG